MSDSLINTISRLSSRPEKFVVILPSGEAVVLMPLLEYEKLTNHNLIHKVNNQPIKPNLSESKIEPIDPLVGGITDDDQFFPEPIE